MIADFKDHRTGTGTKEWAEVNENIQRGCAHGCIYCYAAHNAHRFKMRARPDWEEEELTKKAFVTAYPQKKGVIMFPTAHDITPFNLEAYLRVAKLMLEKGNKLLIVSKPNLSCIRTLTEELAQYRPQIMFRFTIGTMDADTAAFWEPGAPPPAERVQALKVAFEAGYRTSISAEPLLGGLDAARGVLAAVRPYVTDTVWIGKLNKARQRVDMSVPRNIEEIEKLEALQSDRGILEMYSVLMDDTVIEWKDSIKAVLEKHNVPGGRDESVIAESE